METLIVIMCRDDIGDACADLQLSIRKHLLIHGMFGIVLHPGDPTITAAAAFRTACVSEGITDT